MRTSWSVVAVAGLFITATAGASETYQFNPSRSAIAFTVHQYLGTTHGKFTKFNGQIEIDREHPEKSSVTVDIDVASIDTGIAARDNHLRSLEFFDVTKFPKITFRSLSVQQTAPEAGNIIGDLTIHGVTRLVTLHVKLLTPAGDSHRARWATTTEPIKRRDFNLTFSGSAEAISGISQSVSISIEIEAERAE